MDFFLLSITFETFSGLVFSFAATGFFKSTFYAVLFVVEPAAGFFKLLF